MLRTSTGDFVSRNNNLAVSLSCHCEPLTWRRYLIGRLTKLWGLQRPCQEKQ